MIAPGQTLRANPEIRAQILTSQILNPGPETLRACALAPGFTAQGIRGGAGAVIRVGQARPEALAVARLLTLFEKYARGENA